MARNLSAEMIAAVDDPVVYPAWLYKGEFGATTLRLWTGTGALVFNEEIYLGNGWFSDFDPSPEVEQLSAEGFSVTLTGIPLEILSLILSASSHNSDGFLYLAFLNAEGSLLGVPYLKARGGLDVPDIEDSPKDSSVKISYERSLLMLERANGGRYTDQSQRNRYPNDTGLRHIAPLQDLRFTWGKQSTLNSA
jgi:hypothetical protein